VSDLEKIFIKIFEDTVKIFEGSSRILKGFCEGFGKDLF